MESNFALVAAVAASAIAGAAGAAPVVHMQFDDSAALGSDSSGNSNNASLANGPQYASGGITGGALDLRGRPAYLRWNGEANPVEDLLDGDFTFSLWINTTQTFGVDGALAFQGAGIIYADISGTPTGPESDATPLALAAGRLTGLAGNDSLGDLRSTSIVNTGQWVHVAVRRSVGSTVSLFVNGVLESSAPTSNFVDLSAADWLTLGGNTLDGRYYDGLIDEFQGYEGALTDDQIVFLFNNPGSTAPTCPPCAADYDANGGVDGGDLAAFFADFEAGENCADVDNNGGVDGGDLGTFFAAFEAGGCD
jgi:hypothetical protein